MPTKTNVKTKRNYDRSLVTLPWIAIALLAACRNDDVTRPSVPAVRVSVVPITGEAQLRASKSQVDSSAKGRKSRGVQDEMLRIEANAPGFAGYFIDTDGALVARLVKPENEGRARAALAQLIQRREKGAFNSLASISLVRTMPAVYSLSELVAWQEAAFPILLSQDGFSGIGVDVRQNKLLIGVTEDGLRSGVKDVLQKLGIPEAALTIESRGHIYEAAGLRGTWRPTFGGVQIKPDHLTGEDGVCTLGFNVTDGAGKRYALTANHCPNDYHHGPGQTGGAWYQPGSYSSNFMGSVAINPWWTSNNPSGCNQVDPCNEADVAAIAYPDNVASVKMVGRTTCCVGLSSQAGSITVVGQWPVTAIVSPALGVGANVEKLGRTTGWTRGQVSINCFHAPIIDFVSAYHTVRCSNEVSGSAVLRGDSGAPEYIDTMSNSRAAEGILFGLELTGPNGSCSSPCRSYYSPWAQIQLHLGQTLIPY